jgi:hypothetical protein
MNELHKMDEKSAELRDLLSPVQTAKFLVMAERVSVANKSPQIFEIRIRAFFL